MAIEFHCPHCHKLLKTADDKAGVSARCPGCGDDIVVPDLSTVGEVDVPDDPIVDLGLDATVDVSGEVPDSAGEARPCPACGALIDASSLQCGSCGERLVLDADPTPARPTTFVTSDILSRSWTIFTRQAGILIGASFLSWIIQIAIPSVLYGTTLILGMVVDRMGRALSPLEIVGLVIVAGMGLLCHVALTIYLQGGHRQLMLDAAQRKPCGVAQLFSGGRFFFPLLGANALFLAMAGAGLLFGIAPGIYLAVALWPYSFVVVDQKCGVVEAFSRSWEITRGNRLAGFVLLLALIGITAAMSVVTCVGAIAAILVEPFAFLCLAVAYADASGRLTAERNPAEPSPGHAR